MKPPSFKRRRRRDGHKRHKQRVEWSKLNQGQRLLELPPPPPEPDDET